MLYTYELHEDDIKLGNVSPLDASVTAWFLPPPRLYTLTIALSSLLIPILHASHHVILPGDSVPLRLASIRTAIHNLKRYSHSNLRLPFLVIIHQLERI